MALEFLEEALVVLGGALKNFESKLFFEDAGNFPSVEPRERLLAMPRGDSFVARIREPLPLSG